MHTPDSITIRRAGWIALLTGATVLGSFIFACATPFAALATLAAIHMNRRDAFMLMGVNWAANQIVGYTYLNYPQSWDSFAWGAAIGIAALAATGAAAGVESVLRRAGWVVAAIGAFAIAFAAYEGLLYAATAILPSGSGAFSARVVLYVLSVNGLAFIALLALQRAGLALGFAVPRRGAAAA
ncbi:MAG TPA: hypothetical protein VGC27_13740 [Rhizomicrobium sp.]